MFPHLSHFTWLDWLVPVIIAILVIGVVIAKPADDDVPKLRRRCGIVIVLTGLAGLVAGVIIRSCGIA